MEELESGPMKPGSVITLEGREPTHQGCTERTFRKKRVALWDVFGYNWKASKRPPTIRASVSWGSGS